MALSSDLADLAVLAEPQRRRAYELLRAQGAMTAVELVDALDLSRTLLSFHLDKLIEAGFVASVAPERAGRLRGRPARRFVATDKEVEVSIPARHYALVAEVLLAAAHDTAPTALAARAIARERGAQLAAGDRAARPRSRAGRLELVARLLDRLGYAPRLEDQELVLGSCPFERLRAANLELVCSINQALGEGYLLGLGLDGDLDAELRPCPPACCVVMTSA